MPIAFNAIRLAMLVLFILKTLPFELTELRMSRLQIGSQGLFVADNWTGTVICENVVFWGAGSYACNIFPDTGGDTHISFKDVYFVGPFQYGPYNIHDAGGHRIIVDQWDRVLNATVVDGRIVAGSPIAPPRQNARRGR